MPNERCGTLNPTRERIVASSARVASSAVAETHATRSRHGLRGEATADLPALDSHSNSRRISAVLCQRSLGSFARQPSTT